MRKLVIWLVWVAAVIAVGSSCAGRVQELSAYWKGHDFRSTESFKDIHAAEKTFEGFIRLLEDVPEETAFPAMHEFLDSAALNKVAYTIWAGWFEAYLHILESPYHNEPLFQAWLDKVISDKVLDDYIMDHLLQIKKVSGLNVVGSSPSDVLLRDAEGNDFRISDLKGEKVLLLLFNGGCRSCADHMSEIYQEYKGTGTRLVAVMVNSSPEVLLQVERSIPEEVASQWTLSWCPGREIDDGHVYDLTLIPSRLLVGSDGLIEKSYHK